MAYILMAYIVMTLYSYGLGRDDLWTRGHGNLVCRYCPCSYGLSSYGRNLAYRYGPCSYGLSSYGRY